MTPRRCSGAPNRRRPRRGRAPLCAGLAAVAAAFLVLAGVGASAGAAPAPGCSPAAVRDALGGFTLAFDHDDAQQLDAAFAPEPLFQWYSSNTPGPRRTASAEDRASLLAYFHRRHLQHDRLRLARFTFTGNSAAGGNFWFTMRRSADDHHHDGWFTLQGKGVALCTNGNVRFTVLSLGGPGSAAS